MKAVRTKIKKGEKVTVVFSVGVEHPLYKKEVEAIVDFIGGYDGKQIHCHTVEPVHYPEDPKGIYVYDRNDNFIGYKNREAYDEIWEGYIDELVK